MTLDAIEDAAGFVKNRRAPIRVMARLLHHHARIAALRQRHRRRAQAGARRLTNVVSSARQARLLADVPLPSGRR
jgi:hypothetical protein